MIRIPEGSNQRVEKLVANLQSHIDTDHPLSRIDWSQVSAFQRLGMDVDVHEIELTDVAEEIDEVQKLFA